MSEGAHDDVPRDRRGQRRDRWRRHAGWAAALKAVGYVVGLLIIYFALPIKDEKWPIGLAAGMAAVLAVIPVTMFKVKAINRSDRPVGEATQAVALLLGLAVTGSATVNYAMATHTPQFPDIVTKIDSLYFTVATLATVGYGDIAPTGQEARAVVTLQIILNFALVASAVRLLAGIARERRLAEQTGPFEGGASRSVVDAPEPE